MQSYTDLKLKCGDCKDTVTSAALLLQHFARHIKEKHETEYKALGKRELPQSRLLSKKKKKTKSILESVLKVENSSTVSSSEPSPSGGTDSSTVSAFSDFQESSSDNSSVLQTSLNSLKSPKIEDHPNSLDENVKLKSQPPLPLIRFDLQERLENCVMNLSNKKSEILNDKINESDIIGICQSVKKEINNAEVVTENNNSCGTNEEFNPLKFCMITMEENNSVKEIKKVSSRKQLIPKKIEQNVRKLAPKPNNEPKSNDNCNTKLSQKKKYPCHLCSKVFGWSTDLKRHILVHTGERPFKCKTCLASFTRNFLLQKHQSKVHPCSPPKKTPVSTSGETTVVQNSETNIPKKDLQEQTVMIKFEKSESDDDIDEDEDRLVITESFEDTEINNFQNVFQSTVDSKWTTMNSSSERRCSGMDHSDLFSIGQMKVVTM